MSCGYDAGNKSELGAHKCMNSDPFSDSEESARPGSDGDSSESEVDSNISEDEQNQVRKRRSNKTVRKYLQHRVYIQIYNIQCLILFTRSQLPSSADYFTLPKEAQSTCCLQWVD